MQEAFMNLRSYLDEMGVNYAWLHHDPAYTAQTLAMTEHISGKRVIKPVVIKADGQFVLCALPASCFVDIDQLRDELHAREASLASEPELARLFAGCELGAEPPIGNLFGLRTIMDNSLTRQDEVTFQAGTHRDGVTMSMADYMRLASPEVARIGRPRA